MSLQELRAAGLDAVGLATALLQRARRADMSAGVWEAADIQWWWRRPRSSDVLQQLFWTDDQGPVAGVILTEWGEQWTCDPVVVPGSAGIATSGVWDRALQVIADNQLSNVAVPTRDGDAEMHRLLKGAGFSPALETSGESWMAADDRPAATPVPDGFRLVSRRQRSEGPHPMQVRNGRQVEARLQQCSLYDPDLDLAVVAPTGEVAGYGLFWNDPVTWVGMVEPLRTEAPYGRRGIARALITHGLERLAAQGARRLKVSFATDTARELYVSNGFEVTATARQWTAPARYELAGNSP